MSTTQANNANVNHSSGPGHPSHPPYFAPLRPSYFIARPDGVLVPLVPVDELSPQIRLTGTGRSLNYQDTFGMQYVGTLPYTGKYYDLETDQVVSAAASTPQHVPIHSHPPSTHHSILGKPFLAPDAMVRLGMGKSDVAARTTLPAALHHSTQPRPASAAALATNWRKPATESIEKTQATIDAILAANVNTTKANVLASKSTLPASGTARDQEKKVYCTHWIRHGCLYKHEMPDRTTLESIGFRNVPRWYLEKTAPKLEGMSSKPTVGLPMRAAEWLKPSDDSDSDGDVDSSLSELPENGNDECEIEVDAALEVANKPAESDASPTFSFELVSAPSSAIAENGGRKSSAGSDLIDLGLGVRFDPDLTVSTFSPNVNTLPATSSFSPSSSEQNSPRQSSASPLGAESTVSRRPRPRKVFVPAGESPKQHIAEARVRFTRTRDAEIADQAAVPTASTEIVARSTVAAEQSLELAAAPRKDGMMASKHAPPSPFGAGCSGPKGVKVLTRRHSSWNGLNRPSTSASSQPAAPMKACIVDKSPASQQTAFLTRMRKGDELAARRRKPVGWREMSKGAAKAVKPPAATDMAKLKSS
ncbi:hypothetical protein LTR95_003002 [Oleoguttula sp. CCFEE 5521]